MDPLVRALKAAIGRAPASRRELCKLARIDHSFLARILMGERRATPALCQRVAQALEQLGSDCTAGATTLRRAIAQHHTLTKEDE